MGNDRDRGVYFRPPHLNEKQSFNTPKVDMAPLRAVKCASDTKLYGNDWSRVTKDTARTLAGLNGVWDDKYAKLSGGLLVMTVTNRLKGLVKRGGEVRWD